MAIRRCPYCKAIIDEKDKYCENCGTQLLFPEDEYEEEPIPGDKIVDEEETSEKGESEEEPELEEAEEEEEEEAEEEEEEETEEEEEFEAAAEEEGSSELNKFAESEKEEEEIYEQELDYGGEERGEFGEPQEEEREEELAERTPTRVIAEEEEKDERELQSWMALKEEIVKKAQAESQDTTPREFQEGVKEVAGERALEPEEDKKYKVSIEADELVFKTKELDQLTQTVDEGKKDLEKLLFSYEEKKEEKEEKPASETKDELPPWVSGMKEAPPSITPDLEKEAEAEQAPARREWAVDSGIGIPERVTQTTTSFTEAIAGESERRAEQERALASEVAAEEEARHPRGYSLKLKAKCVDLIFITALWLISLAFAAGVIGVSFFRIILVAPLPVLAFYLLLLLLYFFLFLYFLGETLGDHYFSAED